MLLRWFSNVIKHAPGAPAWELCKGDEKGNAIIEFIVLVVFSLSPFIFITLLDWLASGGADIFESVRNYSSAGEIFFYVGAIFGTVFVLLMEDFWKAERSHESDTYTNRSMRWERAWFLLFLLVAAIVSAIVLTMQHFGQESKASHVFWVSLSIYILSLYFWLVSILYKNGTGKQKRGEYSKRLKDDIDASLVDMESEG